MDWTNHSKHHVKVINDASTYRKVTNNLVTSILLAMFLSAPGFPQIQLNRRTLMCSGFWKKYLAFLLLFHSQNQIDVCWKPQPISTHLISLSHSLPNFPTIICYSYRSNLIDTRSGLLLFYQLVRNHKRVKNVHWYYNRTALLFQPIRIE